MRVFRWVGVMGVAVFVSASLTPAHGQENVTLASSTTTTTTTVISTTDASIPGQGLDVRDLRCVSVNWSDLYCNWTLPCHNCTASPYLYDFITSSIWGYSGECQCQGNPMPPFDTCDCPNTCCWWGMRQYSPVDEEVAVNIVIKSAQEVVLGNRNHSFSNYAIVLPAKMKDVSAAPLPGTREFSVTWTLPVPMETFSSTAGIWVRVDHRLADTSLNLPWNMSEAIWYNSTFGERQQVIKVDLWWQRYQVRVRLRSGAAPFTNDEDGWWSDFDPVYITTSPAAPTSAPKLGPGSFLSEDVVPGWRDLTLNWCPTPPLLHNGPGFTYVAVATRKYGKIKEVITADNVTSTFAVFRNVSADFTYRLKVTEMNSEGKSPFTSDLVVGPSSSLPTPPTLPVVVLHGPHHYELRWQREEGVAAVNYTVYLCTDEQDSPNPCGGGLYWSSVGNVTSVNLTLANFGVKEEAATQVRLAVSAVSGDGGWSGLAWDQCKKPQPYTTTRTPPTLADPVMLNNSAAEVSWSLDCKDLAGVVEGVEADYCPGDHNKPQECPDDVLRVSGDVWSGVVVIGGLDSGSKYTVWVWLQYRSGPSLSAQATITTPTPGLASWAIGLITTIAIIVGVIIVLGLLHCRRELLEFWRKAQAEIKPPPGIAGESNIGHGERDGDPDLASGTASASEVPPQPTPGPEPITSHLEFRPMILDPPSPKIRRWSEEVSAVVPDGHGVMHGGWTLGGGLTQSPARESGYITSDSILHSPLPELPSPYSTSGTNCVSPLFPRNEDLVRVMDQTDTHCPERKHSSGYKALPLPNFDPQRSDRFEMADAGTISSSLETVDSEELSSDTEHTYSPRPGNGFVEITSEPNHNHSVRPGTGYVAVQMEINHSHNDIPSVGYVGVASETEHTHSTGPGTGHGILSGTEQTHIARPSVGYVGISEIELTQVPRPNGETPETEQTHTARPSVGYVGISEMELTQDPKPKGAAQETEDNHAAKPSVGYVGRASEMGHTQNPRPSGMTPEIEHNHTARLSVGYVGLLSATEQSHNVSAQSPVIRAQVNSNYVQLGEAITSAQPFKMCSPQPPEETSRDGYVGLDYFNNMKGILPRTLTQDSLISQGGQEEDTENHPENGNQGYISIPMMSLKIGPSVVTEKKELKVQGREYLSSRRLSVPDLGYVAIQNSDETDAVNVSSESEDSVVEDDSHDGLVIEENKILNLPGIGKFQVTSSGYVIPQWFGYQMVNPTDVSDCSDSGSDENSDDLDSDSSPHQTQLRLPEIDMPGYTSHQISPQLAEHNKTLDIPHPTPSERYELGDFSYVPHPCASQGSVVHMKNSVFQPASNKNAEITLNHLPHQVQSQVPESGRSDYISLLGVSQAANFNKTEYISASVPFQLANIEPQLEELESPNYECDSVDSIFSQDEPQMLESDISAFIPQLPQHKVTEGNKTDLMPHSMYSQGIVLPSQVAKLPGLQSNKPEFVRPSHILHPAQLVSQNGKTDYTLHLVQSQGVDSPFQVAELPGLLSDMPEYPLHQVASSDKTDCSPQSVQSQRVDLPSQIAELPGLLYNMPKCSKSGHVSHTSQPQGAEGGKAGYTPHPVHPVQSQEIKSNRSECCVKPGISLAAHLPSHAPGLHSQVGDSGNSAYVASVAQPHRIELPYLVTDISETDYIDHPLQPKLSKGMTGISKTEYIAHPPQSKMGERVNDINRTEYIAYSSESKMSEGVSDKNKTGNIAHAVQSKLRESEEAAFNLHPAESKMQISEILPPLSKLPNKKDVLQSLEAELPSIMAKLFSQMKELPLQTIDSGNSDYLPAPFDLQLLESSSSQVSVSQSALSSSQSALSSSQSALLPSQSAVLPSQSAVSPSQSAVLPFQSQSAILPSHSAVLPSQSAILPSQSAVILSQSAVLPSQSPALPSLSAVLPSQSVQLPSQSVQLPSQSVQLPSQVVQLPAQLAVLPSQSAVLPSESAVLPSESAVLPSESAVLLSQSVHLPSQSVQLPSQSAVLPSQSVQLQSQSAVLPSQSVQLPFQSALLSFHSQSAVSLSQSESAVSPSHSAVLPTQSDLLPSPSALLPSRSQLAELPSKVTKHGQSSQNSYPTSSQMGKCVQSDQNTCLVSSKMAEWEKELMADSVDKDLISFVKTLAPKSKQPARNDLVSMQDFIPNSHMSSVGQMGIQNTHDARNNERDNKNDRELQDSGRKNGIPTGYSRAGDIIKKFSTSVTRETKQ